MRLPNGERAVVDRRKIQNYILSVTYPQGRNKARVFLSALGLTASDADELRTALLEAATTGEAIPGLTDDFGTRYTIDFEIVRSDKRARIRSAWIVDRRDGVPRMTTCFCLRPARVVAIR
jgi:hypothetical protein